MNMRGLPRFIRKPRSRKPWSFATSRFLSGFWRCRCYDKKRTCGTAWSIWKAGETAAAHWLKLESYRMLLPEKSPEYLKELFCSNLRVLLQILHSDCSKVHSGA